MPCVRHDCDGVLTIRTIQGRNGPFNVGRLITDLGEFAVKDTLLEQYEEGQYEGDFNVTQIFPSSYLAGGRFVVEVRATIKSLNLDGVDDLKPEDKEVAAEADPVDSQPKSTEVVVSEQTDQPAEVNTESEKNDHDGGNDEALFDSLWPLGTQVKLDPTVDRLKFRLQRNRLKDLGYAFDPREQIWSNNVAIG
ncbi:MAG: DUF3275 family protein [Gammaproteobacteria bacterium]|nr:DUF3275 family protein [Gammaproteobacteria bacterium]